MDPYAIMAMDGGGWALGRPRGTADCDPPAVSARSVRWVERAIDEHGPEIWRYLVHRVGDRHAADDLLGDVYLALVRDAGRWESRGIPVRAWLFRVASRRAADHFRERRRARKHLELVGPAGPSQLDPSTPDARAWRRALESLARTHQDVLILHHLHALSLEQIAQIEGCRVGTVKSRLSRAREALRRALGATCKGDAP